MRDGNSCGYMYLSLFESRPYWPHGHRVNRRFHDSSFSDTHGHNSRFQRYVLTPPISFGQIVHCGTKPLPRCQCCLQRVALADTEGAADFLGDNDPSEVVPSCQSKSKNKFPFPETRINTGFFEFPRTKSTAYPL